MKFVIATHNKGKVAEFKRLLEPMGIEAVMTDLSEPEETGSTFGENAFLKAESACRETGLPAVADDSGLCVDYLDGAPGIYSARFAEPGKRRLAVLEKLKGVPAERRGAHFVSAVCCVFPNGDRIDAEGKCFGTIAFESRGENGFGYDSIFEQEGRTFGEMTDGEKDERSHRGFAFLEFEKKLREYLENGQFVAPCGLNCAQCPGKAGCPGCAATGGKPFGGTCLLARCCQQKGCDTPGRCFDGECGLKVQLVKEFNDLHVPGMPEVTDLNALPGHTINLEYILPSGQKIKLWDDSRVYLGNQLCREGEERCFGLTADENYLLVCQYGENGADPEIVTYQRRKRQTER